MIEHRADARQAAHIFVRHDPGAEHRHREIGQHPAQIRIGHTDWRLHDRIADAGTCRGALHGMAFGAEHEVVGPEPLSQLCAANRVV